MGSRCLFRRSCCPGFLRCCPGFLLAVLCFANPALNAQLTDFDGNVVSDAWLILGPFPNNFGCQGNADLLLGNHIAPSHIACQYPSEGDEVEFDPSESVADDYLDPTGLLFSLGGDSPIWRRFDEFGLGSGDLNLDGDVNGDLSHMMSWLVTYVEYSGETPTLVELCIGSDDDVQVWFDGAMVHNNPACRARAFCQDVASVFVQPGVHRIALGIWENDGGWGGSLAIRQNGVPVVDGETDDWVFLGTEADMEPPENCEGPLPDELPQPVESLSCFGNPDGGVDLAWGNPPGNDPAIEIQIFSGSTEKTVPGDSTSATLTPDELGEDGRICVVNSSGLASCCSLCATDENGGYITSTHWLAIGPFSHNFGCGTGSGNPIAPSFIGCEYPAAGEELKSGYDSAVASSTGLHPSAPQDDGAPIWYAWNDGVDDGILNLDTGPAGNLDLHMVWLATYVEYVGDAPVDINLCVGSDDGVQIWINDRMVHNNSVCRDHSLSCQDTVPVTLPDPGLYCIRAGVWENGGGWDFSLALQDEFGAPILCDNPDWVFHGKNRPEGFEDMVPGGTECGDCTNSVLDVACEFGPVGFGQGINVSWTNPDDCECATDIELRINGETVATAPVDATSAAVLESRLPDPPFDIEVVNCSGLAAFCSWPPGYNGHGFVRSWLELGPFAQQDGDNPGCDLMRLDHLTDGETTELDIEPVAGDEIETDYSPGEAASLGLNQAENCADCNPDGIPTWHAFTDMDDQFDVNLLVSAGDNQMCYGMFYVDVEEDMTVDIGVDSDDAIQVLAAPVGEEMMEIHCNSIARGAAGKNTIADLIPGIELTEGQWKFMVKVFEGGGGHNWRFRFEEGGQPVIPGPLSLEPGDVGPPPGASLNPGDVNGDGGFNIADMVAELGFLFGGGGGLPECFLVPGSQPPALNEAGFAMLDFNGDGGTNIADAVAGLGRLFGGGNPHALGEGCAEFPGTCASNCVP